MSQRGGSHSSSKCRLTGSWTLREQLGKYVVSRKKLRDGHFASSLCAGNYSHGGRRQCFCTHSALLLCYISVGVTNTRSISYQCPETWEAHPSCSSHESCGHRHIYTSSFQRYTGNLEWDGGRR